MVGAGPPSTSFFWPVNNVKVGTSIAPFRCVSTEITARRHKWIYPFPIDFAKLPGTLVAKLFWAFASSAFLALLPTLEPSQ